ncbi:MAG: alpha/beta hydrolase [Phycisphaeraceae bacterium]
MNESLASSEDGAAALQAQKIDLWPEAGDATLTFYPAAGDASGATVLICPGGGYGHLAGHEGHDVARWLNEHGYHGAVLHYRLGPTHRHPAMIHDAQRAMRLLRHHAAAWGVDGERIAVMGFSAGGHLASSLAVHHWRFACEADELRETYSARPQAAVLCYPVIDLAGEAAHAGSRENLLGPAPEPTLAELMSTHLQVDAQTPATFVWHTADDAGVPVTNALLYAAACRACGVAVELHVYESGRHGLGLAKDEPAVATWTGHCLAFLGRHLGRG